MGYCESDWTYKFAIVICVWTCIWNDIKIEKFEISTTTHHIQTSIAPIRADAMDIYEILLVIPIWDA